MRIRELNDISSGLTEMLRNMGHAINVLSPNAQEGDDSVEARKQQFEQLMQASYVDIQAWQAKMKRQAYALEEAGIIAAEASTAKTTSSQQAQGGGAGRGGAGAAPVVEPERITNGGLGNLDVGWLNSRGNKVSVEKEAELLQEGKALLHDEVDKQRTGTSGG